MAKLLRSYRQVSVFTDGACSPNPGKGGYGAIIEYNKKTKEIKQELFGGFRHTTNNRMEIYAVIVALNTISTFNEPCHITVYSDAAYLTASMSKGWVKRWKNKGWEGNKNIDLWEKLLSLCEKHKIKFVWVKGHSGHPQNERCDKLAVMARKQNNLLVDKGYEKKEEITRSFCPMLF